MDPTDALRARALSHPGTADGVSCAGTALERATVTVAGKAFVFLGAGELRVKLGPSVDDAVRRHHVDPDHFEAPGAHGWTKVILGDAPDLDLLGRWIDESHGLLAPKRTARRSGRP